MRLTKILTFICMILMSTGLVVQATEVDEANAVASLTLADSTQVFYYDSVTEAINNAALNDGSTVQLLSSNALEETISIKTGDFTIDLNGHAIKKTLSINGGTVILKGKGTASSGEYIENLSINKGAYVEIQGIIVKGTDRAITNTGGILVLKSGEVSAGKMAIVNLGGSVTIGEESGKNGEGPVLKAPIGIVNSKVAMGELNWDAVLCIYGGSVTADTDVYNKTGECPYEDEFLSEFPLTAGNVILKGGTFVDGLQVVLDEGLDLRNILDEGRECHGSDDRVIPVESGMVQLNQTVKVGIPAKLGDISTSGDSETTYEQSGIIGVTIEEDTDVYDYTYQWYDASGEIKGATSATYTLPEGLSPGEYSFFCRVTATRKDNGLAVTKDSEPIRITINKAPEPQPDPTPTPDPGVTPEPAPTPKPLPTPEVPAVHAHLYKQHVTKATTQASGKIEIKCACGKVKRTTTIKKIKTLRLSQGEFTYDGKKKAPSVIVKDSNGKELVKGKDYNVTVPNGRKNVGVYTYKITFKGNYKDTKTLKLTIQPKATTVQSVKPAKKAVTVKWKKAAKAQTTGYQVMLATNSKFTKNKKIVTVKGYKITSKKVSKLKAKTKYYVRVRTYKTVKINGKNTKLYSNWTKVRTVRTK